jgi:hypothetical protein
MPPILTTTIPYIGRAVSPPSSEIQETSTDIVGPSSEIQEPSSANKESSSEIQETSTDIVGPSLGEQDMYKRHKYECIHVYFYLSIY